MENVHTILCLKFIQATVYEISSASPKFYRRYNKNILISFSWIQCTYIHTDRHTYRHVYHVASRVVNKKVHSRRMNSRQFFYQHRRRQTAQHFYNLAQVIRFCRATSRSLLNPSDKLDIVARRLPRITCVAARWNEGRLLPRSETNWAYLYDSRFEKAIMTNRSKVSLKNIGK